MLLIHEIFRASKENKIIMCLCLHFARIPRMVHLPAKPLKLPDNCFLFLLYRSLQQTLISTFILHKAIKMLKNNNIIIEYEK